MKKFHHDGRDYAEANSEAAKAMRDRFHAQVERAKGPGQEAVRKIIAEVPRDRIVPDMVSTFEVDEGNLVLDLKQGSTLELHKHAFGQIAEEAGIPKPYLSRLMALWSERDAPGPEGETREEWGAKLAAHNLNEVFRHSHKRHLHRAFGEELRGFLSTRYRRIHQGQLVETFAAACKEVGALPYEAYAGDTKFMVKAVLDLVLEPVRDEVIILGVVLHESPYGNGATEVLPFLERVWCTNKAVMPTTLRQVHLGGRLSDDIEWSEQTYKADSEAVASQVKDIVRSQLGPANVAKIVDVVQQAQAANLKHGEVETYLKKHLSKEDAERVKEIYTSADIENLPQGQTAWRLSNALSFFAGTTEDKEKAYDVQKIAGLALSKKSV
jgi:hypothetical protein